METLDLLHYIPEAVIVCESDKILVVNKAACELLNHCAEELLGSAPSEYLHAHHDDSHDWLRQLRDTARNTGKARIETTLCIDEHLIRSDISISCIDTDREQYLYFIRDISQMRHIEQSLRQAVQDVERANAAKSQFLANISHEIRTPMNGIIGISKVLLMSSGLSDEQRRSASLVNESGKMLLSLLNNLLDYSKIEIGNLSLSKAAFHLPQLVEGVVKQYQPRAEQKSLDLQLHIDIDAPRQVVGDACRVRQVIGCLLDNALKFTQQGEVSVSVRPIRRNDDSVQVRFDVQDTGIGIDKKQLQNIFDPFSRGQGSVGSADGGTGLGLAIARELTQLMRGTVDVQSIPGEGSTFSVVVMLDLVEPVKSKPRRSVNNLCPTSDREDDRSSPDTASPDDIAPQRSPKLARNAATLRRNHESTMCRDLPQTSISENSNSQSPSSQNLSTQKTCRPKEVKRYDCNVLLVDDNTTNQEVGRAFLEHLGCRVDIAGDGFEAVRAVASKSYDIVFMDLLMPRMDGLISAYTIRMGQGPGSSVPIVAVTGHALEKYRGRSYAVGMNGFMTKPVDQVDFAMMLERLCKEKVTVVRSLEETCNITKSSDSEQTRVTRIPIDTEQGSTPVSCGVSHQPMPDLSSSRSMSTSMHQVVSPVSSDDVAEHQSPDFTNGIAVLDMERISAISLGRKTHLLQVITDHFLEDTQSYLDQLREAIEQDDFDSIRRLAHTLKGSAANLGAEMLRQTAFQLQQHADKRSHDECLEIKKNLDNQFELLQQQLRQLLNES